MFNYYFFIISNDITKYEIIRICIGYSGEVKLILIMLGFMKLMFFVRMSDKLGFLVRMIATCVIELIPFIICFIMFLLFFSFCLIILNMEIDTEVNEAEAISFV